MMEGTRRQGQGGGGGAVREEARETSHVQRLDLVRVLTPCLREDVFEAIRDI